METADTYEEYIHPCDVDIDGNWRTKTGHVASVIGVAFDTPDGVEWDSEEVQAISLAIEYVECCPLCDEFVGKQVPLLHTPMHRLLPCCSCDQFVWLTRPDFEESHKEALA